MRKTLQFFSHNTVDCYNISLNGFLFYFIGKRFSSQNIVNCYNVFYHEFFSFQNYLCWFFFLILSWWRIQLCNFFFFLLTEKLNHVAKALYLSSQNIVDCYKSFCSVSKFFITNTTFFFIMKYLLLHTFNFYYLSSVGSQL